jgi:hypothetical protein
MPAGRNAVVAHQQALPGKVLLATMLGWWDPSTYSGSGNLLNKGTAASADMVPGAATAAPTFSVDHFTFDGVNDIMATAGDVTSMNIPNNPGDFTVGAIIVLNAATAGQIIGKRISAASNGWYLDNLGSPQPTCTVREPSHTVSASLGAAVSTGTKLLYNARLTSNAKLTMASKNTLGTPTTDTRTASSTNTSRVSIGGNDDGAGFASFSLYCAFVHAGAITTQNITDICAAYGF